MTFECPRFPGETCAGNCVTKCINDPYGANLTPNEKLELTDQQMQKRGQQQKAKTEDSIEARRNGFSLYRRIANT